MSSAIQKIALYTPIIASSAVFAARRIGRGVNAMDDNPLFGTANFVIAGGQTLKGIRAVQDLNTTSALQHSAYDNIIGMSSSSLGQSRFMQLLGKVFKFSSENINPLICVASGIKVLGSDDKADTAVREILGLSLMFGCEKGAKKLLGMPIIAKNAQGIRETIRQVPLYKTNPFLKSQVNAIKDLCKETKLYERIMSSPLPGIAKGLIFVGASIAVYKLGNKIADWLLGEEQNNKTENNQIQMNTTNLAPAYASVA